MPELSRFFGILIYMYHRDHAPAHFHAEYAEFEIIIGVTPCLCTLLKRATSGTTWSG